MRLKRLELQGFKSFLDRTILTFEKGITGVVGPNGCGKSNIVDAIMWVMGEQSAKHLRGDTMTDVIFNGSDSRSATGMAEVSLILDRENSVLSPAFASFQISDEISVTRRVYRDGVGEYLINKQPCRLKDIHELFMDTGLGKRAYSIIEQGQIDRMINVKPDERKYLFEEVAGVTKYKTKRKEAEKKLELAKQNILRVQDIIVELEKQIRSLKIQATKAKKYREMKEELEVADLYLMGRELFECEKKLEIFIEKKRESEDLKVQLETLLSSLDAQISELEITRIDQEKNAEVLNQEERNLSLSIEKIDGKLNVLEERKKFLQINLQNSESEITEIKSALAKSREERVRFKQQLSDISESVDKNQTEFNEKNNALSELNEQKSLSQDKKDELQEELFKIANEQVSLENKKQFLENKQKENDFHLKELSDKIFQTEDNLRNLASALFEKNLSIENINKACVQAERRLGEVNENTRLTSHQLSEFETELFKKREEYFSKKSRLESLQELQQQFEGYTPSAKEIIQSLGSSVQILPLGEVLQPEAQYEELLELFLAAELNTLVVQTAEEAKKIISLIQEKNLERVNVIALTDLDQGIQKANNSLANFVRAKEGFESCKNFWLNAIEVCETDQELFVLRESQKVIGVSKQTKLVSHKNGSWSAGKQLTQGIFARKREMEELAKVCEELKSKVEALNASREQCLQDLKSQENLQNEVKQELSSLHIQSVGNRKEKESLEQEQHRVAQEKSSVEQKMVSLKSQIETLNSDLQLTSDKLLEKQSKKEEISGFIEENEKDLSEIDLKIDELQENLLIVREEKTRLEEKKLSALYQFQRLENEIIKSEQREVSLSDQLVKDREEIAVIATEFDDEFKRKDLELLQRADLHKRIVELRGLFEQTTVSLNDLRLEKNQKQKQKEDVLSELQNTELELSEINNKKEQLKNITIERYHKEPLVLSKEERLDIEKLPLFTSQLEVTWDLLLDEEKHSLLSEHVKGLKEKIDRVGEVNLTAISEFEEIQKRFDFLTAQKTDLETSISVLEEAIEKIEETTKVRFTETFEIVNKKFKDIFPILFNGGKAELTLIHNPVTNDYGVDIMAMPPGKKLQSISLLSGGEKALTAVSLILAIFARKPSPFCLLDEVDAPLDDANVSRFNTVIRKMSEKTQFIVITHNKKTMEIAEALYGVTMERAGVSKMTSVQLQ